MSAAPVIKEKYLIGMAYIFRGLFHCHQDVTRRDAGRYHAGEVFKYHLDLQATGSGLRHCMRFEHL